MRLAAAILCAALACPAAALDQASYAMAQQVAAMHRDPGISRLFAARGLDVLSVAWEDTGRWKGSAVGPNISDLTIQLSDSGLCRRPGAGCMPVIRYPNFSDRSVDIPIDSLRLPVGNHDGSGVRLVSLRDYLAGFAAYQARPTGWLEGSLLSARDAMVLGSAQACFLPVPRGGEARFNPVLFNYQSHPGDPAVLAILVTPEGTSAQVIDNRADLASGAYAGQRLFHNRRGERASLTAARWTDAAISGGLAGTPAEAGSQASLSMVMVIQVPLVQREPERRALGDACASAPACAPMTEAKSRSDDVDSAVIASGPAEGPFPGLNGYTIRRDERFPIRCTVQFYQATSSGAVSDATVQRLADTVNRVYLDGAAVGSLVTDGCTSRPTEHAAPPQPWVQPQPAWLAGELAAWQQRRGEDGAIALARVRSRLGHPEWMPATPQELRNALELAR